MPREGAARRAFLFTTIHAPQTTRTAPEAYAQKRWPGIHVGVSLASGTAGTIVGGGKSSTPKNIAGIPKKKRARFTSHGVLFEGVLFDRLPASAKAPPLKAVSLRAMVQNRRAPCSATMLGICINGTKTRSMLPKSVAAKRACLLRMMLSAAAIKAMPTR